KLLEVITDPEGPIQGFVGLASIAAENPNEARKLLGMSDLGPPPPTDVPLPPPPPPLTDELSSLPLIDLSSLPPPPDLGGPGPSTLSVPSPIDRPPPPKNPDGTALVRDLDIPGQVDFLLTELHIKEPTDANGAPLGPTERIAFAKSMQEARGILE